MPNLYLPFNEFHLPAAEQAKNPFVRLCAIVAHLREQKAHVPEVLGDPHGAQVTFEWYLRNKFYEPTLQIWLLVNYCWQCHNSSTILEVDPSTVKSMLVAWARDRDQGRDWYIDVDFYCSDSIQELRHWILEAVPKARISTHGGLMPRTAHIGRLHRQYLSEAVVSVLHRYGFRPRHKIGAPGDPDGWEYYIR